MIKVNIEYCSQNPRASIFLILLTVLVITISIFSHTALEKEHIRATIVRRVLEAKPIQFLDLKEIARPKETKTVTPPIEFLSPEHIEAHQAVGLGTKKSTEIVKKDQSAAAEQSNLFSFLLRNKNHGDQIVTKETPAGAVASSPPNAANAQTAGFLGFLVHNKETQNSVSTSTTVTATNNHKPIEFLDVQATTQQVTNQASSVPKRTRPLGDEIFSLSPVTALKQRVDNAKNYIHFLKDHEFLSKVTPDLVPARTAPAAAAIVKPPVKDEYINIHEPIDFVSPHPYVSPRNGTDISLEHQTRLIRCPKQSICIVPELQLEKKLKIYLCKHPAKHGIRFYYIAREGLMLHPNVELLKEDQIDKADFMLYLPGSTPWAVTECSNPLYKSRLIVLDEFDGHNLISPTITPEEYVARYGGRNKQWYFMYFKRSFVKRIDGQFRRYPHFEQPDVYPMTYAIAEAYIPTHFNQKRDIEILCTLRGTAEMTTRTRAQTWVAEYGLTRHISDFVITKQVRNVERKWLLSKCKDEFFILLLCVYSLWYF
jgi:hypothetical protein